MSNTSETQRTEYPHAAWQIQYSDSKIIYDLLICIIHAVNIHNTCHLLLDVNK